MKRFNDTNEYLLFYLYHLPIEFTVIKHPFLLSISQEKETVAKAMF